MSDYYREKLSDLRLKQCYDLATPRVRQYMQAEVAHVLEFIQPGHRVIELGCGYGRVLPALSSQAVLTVGIDNSLSSLLAALDTISGIPHCRLAAMDAVKTAFPSHSFDVTVCIQNGISAFHRDQKEVVRESIRITKPGGKVLFSTYAERFWEHRLEWFYLQAGAGLLGDIDEEKTKNGNIVCKDGFTATTIRPEDFRALTQDLPVDIHIQEIDQSSLFCTINC